MNLGEAQFPQGEFTSPEDANKRGPRKACFAGKVQGFINLWGLPDKVQALREQGKL